MALLHPCHAAPRTSFGFQGFRVFRFQRFREGRVIREAYRQAHVMQAALWALLEELSDGARLPERVQQLDRHAGQLDEHDRYPVRRLGLQSRGT
jgi:hypothetical protein